MKIRPFLRNFSRIEKTMTIRKNTAHGFYLTLAAIITYGGFVGVSHAQDQIDLNSYIEPEPSQDILSNSDQPMVMEEEPAPVAADTNSVEAQESAIMSEEANIAEDKPLDPPDALPVVERTRLKIETDGF